MAGLSLQRSKKMKSLDDVTPDEWSNSASRLRREGGAHYKHEQYETWDVIEDWGLGYFDGNAVKYLSRWHRKGTPIEDLRKARHYIDKLIQLELDRAARNSLK